uniref:Uncharacterized protein n=1 Tax=Candidatus Kentrum sp. LFY TaxID=2126342 RepID=A0A450UF38_9GAMM|nr:MAG: hypothetical protein BECKLFY1418B_GA0070995_10241 [Candidatus Kentron sp. LFY]VFK13478.1 MAG: hypothetical protein BECKLFY1418C_GA0070996_100356 [Candidatus Kentron sp. LFY]
MCLKFAIGSSKVEGVALARLVLEPANWFSIGKVKWVFCRTRLICEDEREINKLSREYDLSRECGENRRFVR